MQISNNKELTQNIQEGTYNLSYTANLKTYLKVLCLVTVMLLIIIQGGHCKEVMLKMLKLSESPKIIAQAEHYCSSHARMEAVCLLSLFKKFYPQKCMFPFPYS